MKEDQVVLGGGCFWCTEAVYLRVPGVLKVESGYAGGMTKNPTYKEICTGKSGHAEVIRITYDSQTVSLQRILEIFWLAHDPTTLNRQGNDTGTQYRSVLYFKNETEKKAMEDSKSEAQKNWKDLIVTEISPLPEFYIAEDYHQNYFALNPGNPYCHYVIVPKVEKLEKIL